MFNGNNDNEVTFIKFCLATKMSLLKSDVTKQSLEWKTRNGKRIMICKLCRHEYGKSAISRSDKWELHLRGGCKPNSTESTAKRDQLLSQLNHISTLQDQIKSTKSTGELHTSEKITFDQELFLDKLTDTIFCGGVPMSIVENTYFVELIHMLNNHALVPSRKTISTLLLERKYDQEKERIRDTLENVFSNNGKLTIHIDSWENPRHQHISSIVLSSPLLPHPVFLESVTNTYTSEDTSFVANHLERIIRSLGEHNIAAICSDNAKYVKNGKQSLSNTFKSIVMCNCICHIVNLILKEFNKRCLRLTRVVETCKEIISFFKDHPKYTYLLNEYNSKKLAGLEAYNATRWRSTYNMIVSIWRNRSNLTCSVHDNRFLCKERLVSGEKVLTPLIGDDLNQANKIKKIIIADEVWSEVKYFIDILHPLINIIKRNEETKYNIQDVYPTFFNILNETNGSKDATVKLLHSCIKAKLDAHFEPTIFKIAHLLDPNQLGKTLSITEKEHLESKMASHFTSTEQQSEFRKQWLDFQCHIIRLRGDIACGSNLFDYFTSLQHQLCLVSEYGKFVFSVTSSNSNIERVFSMYSFIHSKVRNRLTGKHAEMIMYIYNNKKLQEKQELTLGLSIAETLFDSEDDVRSKEDIFSFFNAELSNDTLNDDELSDDESNTANSSNAESNDDNLISTSFKHWGIVST